MSLATLINFLCAQHASDIYIYPSSGACDHSFDLTHWSMFLVRSVLEFRYGWVGVVYFLLPEACNTTSKLQHTSNKEHTTNVIIQQNSRKLLMMDILMSETC